MDVAELERSYNASKDKSDIKAIVIINPGNPTGQVNNKNGDWMNVKDNHERSCNIGYIATLT